MGCKPRNQPTPSRLGKLAVDLLGHYTKVVISARIYVVAGDIGQANEQVNAGLRSVPGDMQLLNEGIFVSLRILLGRQGSCPQASARNQKRLSHGCDGYWITTAAPTLVGNDNAAHRKSDSRVSEIVAMKALRDRRTAIRRKGGFQDR
jgi:hypothetical protein